MTLTSVPAFAVNELNSSETPGSSAATPQPAFAKNEFTVVPVVGGSTDIGIAAGYFAGLTQNKRGFDPYVWNVESAGLVSFTTRDGHTELPLVDVYLKWTVPRFQGSPLAIDVRPSFTDEQELYYYGMGNASQGTAARGDSQSHFQFARIHPSFMAVARFKLFDHVAGIAGLRYTATFLDIPNGSALANDIRDGTPEVRKLIGPTGPQSVALFIYGLQIDTRDNEVTPHVGMFHEAKAKLSPGGTESFQFRYLQTTVNLRAYVPLFTQRLTLALRVVGNAVFGDAPFYELSRFEDTYAVGGSNGVRGVPAGRYYGKIQLFGNVEVRARLVDFKVFRKPLSIGLAAFFDGGRVWADTSPHPELDGTGIGLKYGVGGGLRLMSGSAFVLRGDVAWSPDARPVGAYVAAGEIF